MYNKAAGTILAVLNDFERGWLVGRCMRDFCDTLGFIIETGAHEALNYRARSDILNYWLHRLRMFHWNSLGTKN